MISDDHLTMQVHVVCVCWPRAALLLIHQIKVKEHWLSRHYPVGVETERGDLKWCELLVRVLSLLLGRNRVW